MFDDAEILMKKNHLNHLGKVYLIATIRRLGTPLKLGKKVKDLLCNLPFSKLKAKMYKEPLNFPHFLLVK